MAAHNIVESRPERARLRLITECKSPSGVGACACGVQVSPDGLLVQAATQADASDFTFRDGEQGILPGPYIEFAQRHRLPEFAGLDVRPPFYPVPFPLSLPLLGGLVGAAGL